MFDNVIELLNLIENNGFKAFIVGGAVRDYLIDKNQEIKDFDVCSNITDEKIKELFEVKSSNVGSYKIVYKNINYDLTQLRVETNTSNDNRHPNSFEFVDDYVVDSNRRDFTVNSLYMDKDLNVYDPQNGLVDLSNKQINLIGNKENRFVEDSTRLLRCIYFKLKLGFEIEKETLKYLKEKAYLIEKINYNIVLDLFNKIFELNKFEEFIKDLYETGLYKFFKYFDKSIELCYQKNIKELNLLEFFLITNILDNDFIEDYPVTRNIRNFIFDCTNLSAVTEEDDICRLQLFTYKLEKCLLVTKINNILFNKNVSVKTIEEEYNQLPIKGVCDLKFKGFDLITKYKLKAVSVISVIVDDIKFNVLFGNIANEYNQIKDYVENKYKGVFIDD